MKRTTLRLSPQHPDFAVESWNAFIELLATSDASELHPSQRPAHFVFWYESEVQNGGHLQYFCNRGYPEALQAVESLRLLGAVEHADLLFAALTAWDSHSRPDLDTVDDFVAEALSAEFAPHDQRFGQLAPLTDVLERHLQAHQDAFLILSPGA